MLLHQIGYIPVHHRSHCFPSMDPETPNRLLRIWRMSLEILRSPYVFRNLIVISLPASLTLHICTNCSDLPRAPVSTDRNPTQDRPPLSDFWGWLARQERPPPWSTFPKAKRPIYTPKGQLAEDKTVGSSDRLSHTALDHANGRTGEVRKTPWSHPDSETSNY